MEILVLTGAVSRGHEALVCFSRQFDVHVQVRLHRFISLLALVYSPFLEMLFLNRVNQIDEVTSWESLVLLLYWKVLEYNLELLSITHYVFHPQGLKMR